MTITLLAVDGTLIRDLELNPSTQRTGGIFVREDRTDAHYRLWSINSHHPGVIRVDEGGTHANVEIQQLPLVSFAALLMSEPAELAIDKIKLADSGEVLGVLAESWLTKDRQEITELGSWRKYTRHFHTV